jgi:hypothetical protein
MSGWWLRSAERAQLNRRSRTNAVCPAIKERESQLLDDLRSELARAIEDELTGGIT